MDTRIVKRTKLCSNCGKTKRREQFARKTSAGDGLQVWCKPCALYRKHNPVGPKPPRDWKKSFLARVDRSGGPAACHMWTTGKTGDGYGQFYFEGQVYIAHRVAYELKYGPIPDGLRACHDCDQRYPVGDTGYRACCNPRHLFLGTDADNMRDKMAKGRARNVTGENVGTSKLTKAKVIEIRRLYATRKWFQCDLAERFGVSKPLINLLIKGVIWQGIGEVAAAKGTRRRGAEGERSGLHKIGTRDVRKLRRLRQKQGFSYPRLGAMFGISHVQARNIVVRKSWAHVA